MIPQRIRLSREPGWRKPEGAVVVARPSRWGNPFKVEQYGRDLAVAMFRMAVTECWTPDLLAHLSDEEYQRVIVQRSGFRSRLGGHPAEMARSELAGHDLCCWCPLDVACHADVLLQVANR